MLKAIVAFAVLCFIAVPLYAGAPVNGAYFSPPLGGDVLEGRYSECYVGGGQGMPGNTVHALSWDGANLGTQWGVFCPVLSQVQLMEDTVDQNGNGHRTYRTVYDGGRFWLTGAAAWGGGDPSYAGSIDLYVHTTTFQFQGGQIVGYVTDAELMGNFDGYASCIMLTIANAYLVGMYGIPPAGFPVLKNGVIGPCVDATGILGEWGNVHSITLVIDSCPTSTRTTSWGGIKSMYR